MTERIATDRLAKLTKLREKNRDPYPPRVPRPVSIRSCLENYDERQGDEVTVAGRLTQTRDFGKLRFSHLCDRDGQIQIGFERDRLPDFWPDRKLVEANDIVVITGELGLTKKGERTIWAKNVTWRQRDPSDTSDRGRGLHRVASMPSPAR